MSIVLPHMFEKYSQYDAINTPAWKEKCTNLTEMANIEFMHGQTVDKLNSELRVWIISARDLENRVAKENLNGEQEKAAFAEVYPPNSLYSLTIQTKIPIFPELRTLLDEHGAALTSNSSHKIIMTLNTTVYSENDDNEAATAIVRAMISARRSRLSSRNGGAASSLQSYNQGQSCQVQFNSNIPSRIASNMAMHFRTDKFTGDIGEL